MPKVKRAKTPLEVLESTIKKRINIRLAELGKTKIWLSKESGISYRSIMRRFGEGHVRDIKVGELLSISQALSTEPAALLENYDK